MVDAQDPDFFISYTESDEPWAGWTAMILEHAGYRVHLRAWDFKAGSFVTQMDDAVRNAAYLLPIVSSRYETSRYGRFEWAAFLQDDETKIIPIHVEEISGRSLLHQLDRIRLFGRSEEDCRTELTREIGRLYPNRPSSPGERARHIIPFPGAVRLDGSKSTERGDHPQFVPPIEPNPGSVQLVIAGSGQERQTAVNKIPAILGVSGGRVLNMFDATMPADAQIEAIKKILAVDDGPEPSHESGLSDVVVVLAGAGHWHSASGWAIHTAAGGAPLRLPQILDVLRFQNQKGVRVHLLLDIIGPAITDVPNVDGLPFPVLTLRASDNGRGGVGRLVSVLSDRGETTPWLGHGFRLTLDDLAKVEVGMLSSVGTAIKASEIGLFANPHAWRTPAVSNAGWCFVQSVADQRAETSIVGEIVSNLESYNRDRIQDALRDGSDPQITLARHMARCPADTVLTSPAAFAHAVREVCRARVAVFDLTNYEPAVMVLLGIRSVIRRGVTLCIHGNHDAEHPVGAVPFQVQEVSIFAAGGSREENDLQQIIRDRLLTGIKQLQSPDYADLPPFTLVRSLTPPEANRPKPFDAGDDRTMLALVPFNEGYTRSNWRRLADRLPQAARSRAEAGIRADLPLPTLRRTLDMWSPRIVSPRLYEALRLIDFCLVDLTHARPSVMFELGVRLTVNSLHPVVILEDTQSGNDQLSQPVGAQQEINAQRDQIAGLLQAIRYSPILENLESDPYDEMVLRHLRLRTAMGTSENSTVLAGFPPRGVYELAWGEAVEAEEPVAIPVDLQLQAEANALIVDPAGGARRMVYPSDHQLARTADRLGRERLVAAWLYQTHRLRVAESNDREARADYTLLSDRLLALLEAGDTEDDARFAQEVDAHKRAMQHADEGGSDVTSRADAPSEAQGGDR